MKRKTTDVVKLQNKAHLWFLTASAKWHSPKQSLIGFMRRGKQIKEIRF